MHIDAVELFHLAFPITARDSVGRHRAAPVESVVVQIRGGDHSGWGEVFPGAAPDESEQWAGGAMALLGRWLAPAVVGNSIAAADDLHARLATFRGNSFAKAALDVAWWDLEARRRGIPLFRALGATRDAVRLAATFTPMDSIDELIAAVETVLSAGYSQIVLKLRAGWSLDVVRAVRQCFPAVPLAVDFDAACSLDQRDLFYRLEDFALAWIEQPLDPDDLVGHAMLQETMRTPIALDQSVTSVERARQAIDLGSCRAMSLRTDRCGGFSAALAIRDACREAGVTCRVVAPMGAAPSSVPLGVPASIAWSAAVALATLDGVDDTMLVESEHDCTAADAGAPPIMERDARLGPYVRASSQPGLGFEPDVQSIMQYCIAHKEFRAP